jgi:hypothetical protein
MEKKMEKLYAYVLLMLIGSIIALVGLLGLFLAYSYIYIFILFAGVIIFNLGYAKAYNRG